MRKDVMGVYDKRPPKKNGRASIDAYIAKSADFAKLMLRHLRVTEQ